VDEVPADHRPITTNWVTLMPISQRFSWSKQWSVRAGAKLASPSSFDA
jgi:hypothetical protein